MRRPERGRKRTESRVAMKIIAEALIRTEIGPHQALEAARRAFRALGTGSVQQPAPMSLEFPGRNAEAHIKCAVIEGADIYAVKVASGFYDLPDGVPSGNGVILVFDAADGTPLGVLADGGYLTDLRTGAAGALAADLLAPKDIQRVAVVGAGAQARYQLEALGGVRAWSETTVWSRRVEKAAQYAREMEERQLPPVRVCESLEAAVNEADVVITTTTSREPLVRMEWLLRSATVVAVGADSPYKQELEPEILARAGKVVVDDWSQCLRLGEIHHAIRAGALDLTAIHAELGKIVTGESPGREADELIVCDLTGVGALDAAIAETTWTTLRNAVGPSSHVPRPRITTS